MQDCPAYDEIIDRRIFERDNLPLQKKTINEIVDDFRGRFSGCAPSESLPELLMKSAKRAYDIQEGKPIYPKDGSEVVSFVLPSGKAEAIRLLERIKNLRFRTEAIAAYEAEHRIENKACTIQPTLKVKAKKERPSQVQKTEVRRIAAQKWETNPEMTIQEMIFDDEVNTVAKDKCEKTLRNWVKDLAPNRKPGRRPNKK